MPFDFPVLIGEALKMAMRRKDYFLRPIRRHRRSADPFAICTTIISRCWDERNQHFRTSAGHFSSFYIRDFSWCCEPLLRLGYRDAVRNTIRYALDCYQRANRVTTSIHPSGRCFDFPGFALDSFPSLLRCVYELGETPIIETYRLFLQRQLNEFIPTVWNIDRGWLRTGISVSSIRDHRVHDGTCYDASMLFQAVDCANRLGLLIPYRLRPDQIAARLIERYRLPNGGFREYEQQGALTGDSIVFPFWTGAIRDPATWIQAATAAEQEGLADPAPLRYERRAVRTRLSLFNLLAPNYQGTTTWMHIGLLYCQLVRRFEPHRFEACFERIRESIITYRTLYEVFDDTRNGKLKPFESLFYMSDSDILWAAIAADLMK